MKIAFFSDSFFPELGGIPDSIIATGQALAERGHQIRFYASNYSTRDYKIAGLEKKELKLGQNIEIIRLPSLSRPAASGQERMAIPMGLGWLSLHRWKPDIIHSQTIFGIGLEGMIASKLLKKPFVGTNHSILREFLRYGPLKTKWFNELALKYAAWFYGKCDFVSGPSNAAFNELIDYGFHAPHEPISNPVDTKIFNAGQIDKQKVKNLFGLSDNTVVCAGRIASEKNIDILVRAVAIVREKIPNITLAVAGRGSEEKKLKKLSKDIGMEQGVKFLGILDKSTLASLYRASEAFVIASTSETQSMVLTQAMACGLPVVGVNSMALPEYIKDNENGLVVEPNDPQAFALGIVSLLNDPLKRELMSKKAVEFVQQFSIPRIATKWEVAYQKVIEKFLIHST